MSEIKVNAIKKRNGSSITIGEGGDTVTITPGIVGTTITSGTVANARLVGSGAITINGSAVSLGGSVTIGETKPTVTGVTPSTIPNTATNVVIAGTNFVSVPQVEALNQSTGIWYTADTISFTNATTLVATFTLSVDAQYKLRIENPDGNAVLSSSSPGKKPISLVGINERTNTTFSYFVCKFNTSCIARYKDTNVLPVPAQPNKN